MALAYNVWTEEEIESRNIVECGNYPFEVKSALLKKTKPGFDRDGNQKQINDMLEFEFTFWDQNGVVRNCRDWIVLSERMDWKLRHIANTLGLLSLYESKELDVQHFCKKQGVFELGVKDFTDQYGVTKKINYVKDYTKKEVSPTVNSASFLDDDIPNL